MSLAAGIGLTMMAAFLFASLDSLGKEMTLVLPVIQVIWARYFFQTIVITGYLAARKGGRFLKTRRPKLQIIRALTLLMASLSVYHSLPYVSIAEATAVLFFSPLLVTVLSTIFLKEEIGLHRFMAVITGLIGMLLIVQPGFGAFNPYLLLPLAGAFFNALYLILTSQLSDPYESEATQFHTTATGTVILSFAVIWFWQTPTPQMALSLFIIGFASALAHFCLIRAFSQAPASLLSPFLYSQVLFAAFFAIWWFGDSLHPLMILGSMLLILSGLYIWWRENRRRKALWPS